MELKSEAKVICLRMSVNTFVFFYAEIITLMTRAIWTSSGYIKFLGNTGVRRLRMVDLRVKCMFVTSFLIASKCQQGLMFDKL